MRALIPELSTFRFVLKPIETRDEQLYIRIYTDSEIMRHVGEVLSPDAARKSFRRALQLNSESCFKQRSWIIRDIESNNYIGLIAIINHGLLAEIGVMVVPTWQNHKVAQEVIRRVTDYGFSAGGLDQVFARHLTENIAGAGVMRRLGFSPMGDVPGGGLYVGWAMNRDTWLIGS